MEIFKFFTKKKKLIDFSEENVSELIIKSDLLGQTLIDNKLGYHVDHISKIRLAAVNRNEIEFKKLVISPELFGGAGALWEINIPNSVDYKKFNTQFSEYIDLLIRMGIENGRVRQIRKTMSFLNKKL